MAMVSSSGSSSGRVRYCIELNRARRSWSCDLISRINASSVSSCLLHSINHTKLEKNVTYLGGM